MQHDDLAFLETESLGFATKWLKRSPMFRPFEGAPSNDLST